MREPVEHDIFEFASPQIVFGIGASARLGELTRRFGQRTVVVVGGDPNRHQALLEGLAESGVTALVIRQRGEPTDTVIEATVAELTADVDVVLGIGGGSVIDTAKAIAALVPNGGRLIEYVEVVGAGRDLAVDPLPVLAVPTTAGTGAEATRNAVVSVSSAAAKVSLRHPGLLPRVALVDPELTASCTPNVTAESGFDALTQCIESYVSPAANELTSGLALRGAALCVGSLERAVAEGSDLSARRDMAAAALLSGMALANSKLGAVHGIAGPLGAVTGVGHGKLCSLLLAPVVAANLDARLDEAFVARYSELASLFGETGGAVPSSLVEEIHGMVERCGVEKIALEPLTEDEMGNVVSAAQASSSMRGNPVTLSDDVVAELVASCWT